MKNNQEVIWTETLSLVQTYRSDTYPLDQRAGFALCLETTGAGDGDVWLEASVDDATFVTIANTTAAFSGGDNAFYNVINTFYKSFRIAVDVQNAPVSVVATVYSKGV